MFQKKIYIILYISIYIYIYVYIYATALRRAEAPETPERYTGYKTKSLTQIPSPEQHTGTAT